MSHRPPQHFPVTSSRTTTSSISQPPLTPAQFLTDRGLMHQSRYIDNTHIERSGSVQENTPVLVRSANEMVLGGTINQYPSSSLLPPFPPKPTFHSPSPLIASNYTSTIETHRPLNNYTSTNSYFVQHAQMPHPLYPPTSSGCMSDCCTLDNCFLCGCCPCVAMPTPVILGPTPSIRISPPTREATEGCCFCPECNDGLGCRACLQSPICLLNCCCC